MKDKQQDRNIISDTIYNKLNEYVIFDDNRHAFSN